MLWWILVADAARAKVFGTDLPPDAWQLQRYIENRPGRARPQELLSDKPGRYSKGGKRGVRSAMEYRTPVHVVEEERFAKELSGMLQKALALRAYHALGIVAPPQLLGMMRQAIGPEVSKHLRITADKDWITLDDRQLLEHLKELLAAAHPIDA